MWKANLRSAGGDTRSRHSAACSSISAARRPSSWRAPQTMQSEDNMIHNLLV